MLWLLLNLFERIGEILTLVGRVTLLCVAVLYLLYAAAIHRLAGARGIKNPWLAFVPGVRFYTLGAVADDIRAAKGRGGNSRRFMLCTALAAMGIALSGWSSGVEELAEAGTAFAILLMLVLMMAETLALYRIFREYRPQRRVLYTVLCVIPYTRPFAKVALLRKMAQASAPGSLSLEAEPGCSPSPDA